MPMLSAELVDAGVGLPSVWRDPARGVLDGPHEGWRECVLSLDDSLNRFGLLRQLALWAGDDGEGMAYWLSWDGQYNLRRASGVGGRGKTIRAHLPAPKPMVDWDADALRALKDIVEFIGMDHAVRRKLGWGVTPNNWATLWKDEKSGLWVLQDAPGNFKEFDSAATPALATATGLFEPLRAVYEEVCNDDV